MKTKHGYSVHLCGDDSINQECKDVDVIVSTELYEDPVQVALRDNPDYNGARINLDENEEPITWVVEGESK